MHLDVSAMRSVAASQAKPGACTRGDKPKLRSAKLKLVCKLSSSTMLNYVANENPRMPPRFDSFWNIPGAGDITTTAASSVKQTLTIRLASWLRLGLISPKPGKPVSFVSKPSPAAS
ncbi:hypothetical protein FRB94_008543 [Tulasnella sp. JGI-2019a]|nr:hypothetical protein FRB94_008543 [Tulasnella sp. JGI-2019a]